jgi:hypothetical protein
MTFDGLHFVLSLTTISFSILLLFPVKAYLYGMWYRNEKYSYDEMQSVVMYHFGQDWSLYCSLQSGKLTTRLALLLNKSDCLIKHDNKRVCE